MFPIEDNMVTERTAPSNAVTTYQNKCLRERRGKFFVIKDKIISNIPPIQYCQKVKAVAGTPAVATYLFAEKKVP